MNTKCKGFALVLALSLMSFLLLLVLAILSFATLESKNSLLSRERLIAKQNAITGLYLAIGDLQKYLGPDQRATATADILEKDNAPYTLVWNSNTLKKWDDLTFNWTKNGQDANSAPIALTSLKRTNFLNFIQNNGNINSELIEQSVPLFKHIDQTTNQELLISGEKLELAEKNSTRIAGHYAWAIQDQSLKASLSYEHTNNASLDNNDKVINKDHPLALPESSRLLSIFPYADPSGILSNDDKLEPLFSNLSMLNIEQTNSIKNCTSINDISLVKSIADAEKLIIDYGDYIKSNFCIYSRGILADSRNGGLRKDLTRGLDDSYFNKLHGKPVFGLDEYNNREIINGSPSPIGDQWKFFRDFYNAYKKVDDGLVQKIDAKNIFLGLDDVTEPNPSTPIRITNKDVGKHINYLYPSQFFMNGRPETTYNHSITPRVARSVHKEPQATSTSNAWYLFTTAIRPIVLRNTFKIGLKSTLDSTTGKYVLQFEVFPSMVIWNPFNFTLDLSEKSIENPMCVGNSLETHIHGNDRFVISVNNDQRIYAVRNGSWAPKVIGLYKDLLTKSNMPNSMPPGEVWVLGLDKSYTADIVPIYGSEPASLYPPSVTNATELANYSGDKLKTASYGNEAINLRPSTGYGRDNANLFPLYLAKSSNNVSENNSITYTCRELMTHDRTSLISGFRTVGRGARKRFIPEVTISAVWEEALFDPTDTIRILNFNKTSKGITQRVTGEYDWTGKITKSPNSARVEAFHHYENADLRVPPYAQNVDIEIGQIGALSSGNSFPFYQIDFIARTSGEENNSGINNAAFPAFANVNFLGTQPLVVTSRDTTGDIKSMYIPQKVAGNHSFDAIPPRDNNTGKGFFGSSFDVSNTSSSKITLYDLPRHPQISVADFKHLALSWFEDSPPRPIGASWPNPTLRRLSDTFIPVRFGSFEIGAGCDVSYFYNSKLFDSYFFSGINVDENYKESVFPYGKVVDQAYLDSRLPLANTRLVNYQRPILDDVLSNSDVKNDGYDKTSANFLIDSPFNVNSTSKLAWQAVLSGFRNTAIVGVNNSHSSKKEYLAEGSAFVDNFIPSNDENDLFSGFRRLNDTELASLSYQITEVIKTRGISKNLGDFTNRNPYSSNILFQKVGRLDQAIELAGINSTNHKIAPTTSDQSEVQTLSAGNAQAQLEVENLAPDSGAGLPGYFKQQDILRPLAPIMTTRGDTFVVRAYGDSSGATNDLSTVRVVCEATVQRIPEYVDGSIDPWEKPLKNSSNDLFGRKFKIISFKWIDLDDV